MLSNPLSCACELKVKLPFFCMMRCAEPPSGKPVVNGPESKFMMSGTSLILLTNPPREIGGDIPNLCANPRILTAGPVAPPLFTAAPSLCIHPPPLRPHRWSDHGGCHTIAAGRRGL